MTSGPCRCSRSSPVSELLHNIAIVIRIICGLFAVVTGDSTAMTTPTPLSAIVPVFTNASILYFDKLPAVANYTAANGYGFKLTETVAVLLDWLPKVEKFGSWKGHDCHRFDWLLRTSSTKIAALRTAAGDHCAHNLRHIAPTHYGCTGLLATVLSNAMSAAMIDSGHFGPLEVCACVCVCVCMYLCTVLYVCMPCCC